jgi:selenocysteine lyase/cysteine desulfurase
MSQEQTMPDFLPDRGEAGTLNVPGIAGLSAGLDYVASLGEATILKRQQNQVQRCAAGLRKMGIQIFDGPHQAGTLSFLPGMDCQNAADKLWKRGIAVRAGLHCAPLAHESAGTLSGGTVRISFGHNAEDYQSSYFLSVMGKLS